VDRAAAQGDDSDYSRGEVRGLHAGRCPAWPAGGARLKPELLAVTLADKSIARDRRDVDRGVRASFLQGLRLGQRER